MSAVTTKQRPSHPGFSSTVTSTVPSTSYQKLTRAFSRRPSEKKRKGSVPTGTITMPMSQDDGGADRQGVFKSPLFHYASRTQLPLSPYLSRPSGSTPDLGIRGRSATIGGSGTASVSRSWSVRKPVPVSSFERDLATLSSSSPSTPPPPPPPNHLALLSREEDSIIRQRALSQPAVVPRSDAAALQRKPSKLSSTSRGARKGLLHGNTKIIDMRSATSSPAPSLQGYFSSRPVASSQGYTARTRNTVSPLDTVSVSPLYAVNFPGTPLGREEPRNANNLNPDRAAREWIDRAKPAQHHIEILPDLRPPYRNSPTNNVSTALDEEVPIPTERTLLLEDKLQQLRMQSSSRQLQEERPKSQRGDASESAEALLSLIHQNGGSIRSSDSVLSSTGLPRYVSQTLSDSQESGTNSTPSTLGSFSLHTISHPVAISFPSSSSLQRGDSNPNHLTHLKQFKSAVSQYNSTQERQSYSSSVPSHSIKDTSSLSQSNKSQLKFYLDEEDIEIIEENPIHQEQATLIGVRRKLVEQFEDLGKKSGRILSSRGSSINMSSSDGSSSHHHEGHQDLLSDKELRRKEDDLRGREKELTIEALSKAEMAYVRIEIWTESRKGKWIIRGAAENDGYPPEELPPIVDPWAIPIDSKGIVRRKKLKSNVELSSTRTIVDCPHCADGRQMGINVQCRTCDNSTRVEMVYSVQCIVRQVSFLPLKLPAVLLLGAKQPHIKYVEASDPGQIIDILRDRAVDGLQSAAERVLKTHHAQHGSRLLLGQATIKRRGLLSVSVTSSKTKARRNFDVEDGIDGKIIEVKVIPATRMPSLPAQAGSTRNASIERRPSISPLVSASKSPTNYTSLTSSISPPLFANLIKKRSKEGFSPSSPSSSSTPQLSATLTRKNTNPPEQIVGSLKPKKSIRDMFYR